MPLHFGVKALLLQKRIDLLTQEETRKLKVRLATLRRYKVIKEYYNQQLAKNPHVPFTKLLSEYIAPVYPISKCTLYRIVTTSITSEIRDIEMQLKTSKAPTLFD